MILGGFGFLSRLYGLSIDALVEAEVVLADGTITIVNAKENQGAFRNCHSHQQWLNDQSCRSMVGDPRSRTCVRHHNTLQGVGVPRTGCICG